MDPAVDRLATQLVAAIEQGDVDTIRAQLYAHDAVIWHATDGREESPTRNLRTLAWMHATLSAIRYEEIHRQATPSGYVQQHVLRATLPDGGRLELPACLIVTVAGGRITRLDEYFDSAAIACLAPWIAPRPS